MLEQFAGVSVEHNHYGGCLVSPSMPIAYYRSVIYKQGIGIIILSKSDNMIGAFKT